MGTDEAQGPLGALPVHLGEILVVREEAFAQDLGIPVHAGADGVPLRQQPVHGDAQEPAALLQGVVHIVAPSLQSFIFHKL